MSITLLGINCVFLVKLEKPKLIFMRFFYVVLMDEEWMGCARLGLHKDITSSHVIFYG